MKPKKTPLRTCVACGRSASKHELVRIVRSPDGETRIDASGKANGRGAYVCATQACFEAAIARKRLTSALRVTLGEEDQERLRSEFEAAVRNDTDSTSRSGR
jgi:hypothetical protein